MSEQPKTQTSIDIPKDSIVEWLIGFDGDAKSTPPSSSHVTRIPRVPEIVTGEKHDYERYYVPKFVSIGPYHHENVKLKRVEKRKSAIAMKLFSDDTNAIISLYEKLRGMVKDLRSFYEENSTSKYCDNVFTKMMLFDGCFVMYFVNFLYGRESEDYSELKSNDIIFVRRDLYLLENQIPFEVLNAISLAYQCRSSSRENDLLKYLKLFVAKSSFVRPRKPKRGWFDTLNITRHSKEETVDDEPAADHLLGVLYRKNTKKVKPPANTGLDKFKIHDYNFRNVSELADVGIRFMPIKETLSLTRIEFDKGWLGCYANVKLPQIRVSDCTKPMLLNLMAYETCRGSLEDSWVTSYVSLLSSLIDDVADVQILRKGWVLKNHLASDKEVVEFFDEIGTDLGENATAYSDTKYRIQRHFKSRSNTLVSQLKNEYFKTPWAVIAFVGALIALFFSGVSTYFTVWSPKDT